MEKQPLSHTTSITINNSKNDTSSTSTKYNQKNFYTINTIYKNSYDALKNYNPDDSQSITSIFHIISQIEELQNKGINEKEVGHFAYLQTINNPSLATISCYNPLHVSIILERIVQHKAHMKKNNFIAPTKEHFIQHMDNIRAEVVCDDFAKHRLIIYPNHPQNNQLPENELCGFKELKQLIYDIYELKQKPLAAIKKGADIIYGEKKQQACVDNPKL
jgi:hypothetical protein